MSRPGGRAIVVATLVATLAECGSDPPTSYERAEDAAKAAGRISVLINGIEALNRQVRMLPNSYAPNSKDLFFLPSTLVDDLLKNPRLDLYSFLLSEAGENPAYLQALSASNEPLPDGWQDSLAKVRDLDATTVFKVLPRTCNGLDESDGCDGGEMTGAGDLTFGKDALLIGFYQELTPYQGIARQEKTFAQRYINSQMFRTKQAQPISQSELKYLNQLLDRMKARFKQAGLTNVEPIQLAPPGEKDYVATLAAYPPPHDDKIRVTPGLVRAFFVQCASMATRADQLLKAWDRCPENDPRRSYLTMPKYDPFPSGAEKRDSSPYDRADSRALACRLASGSDATTMQRLVDGFSECMQEVTSFVLAHELAHVQLQHGYTTLEHEIAADRLAMQVLGGQAAKSLAGSSLLFQAIEQNAGEYWGVSAQAIADLRARMKLLGLEGGDLAP